MAGEAPEDREKAIAAIAAQARAERPKYSRAMWTAATLAIIVGAIAFVIVVFSDAEPSRPLTNLRPTTVHEHRAGLVSGLVIGLGVGIAIGFMLARRKRG